MQMNDKQQGHSDMLGDKRQKGLKSLEDIPFYTMELKPRVLSQNSSAINQCLKLTGKMCLSLVTGL